MPEQGDRHVHDLWTGPTSIIAMAAPLCFWRLHRRAFPLARFAG